MKPGLVNLADQIHLAVQVVPRITDAIQEGIERVANTHVDNSDEALDVGIVELLRHRLGRESFFKIPVSFILMINSEEKKKPT
ncbi:hypothetical protein NHJ13051_001694 [Beauveria bassiana]